MLMKELHWRCKGNLTVGVEQQDRNIETGGI